MALIFKYGHLAHPTTWLCSKHTSYIGIILLVNIIRREFSMKYPVTDGSVK